MRATAGERESRGDETGANELVQVFEAGQAVRLLSAIESTIGPEWKLNVSGQRRDSSHGAPRNKKAV